MRCTLLALFVILSGGVLPAGRSIASPLFESAPSFPIIGSSLTIAMDDWNHDGNADVAFIHSTQELAVYRSNGDGTFSPGVVYPTGSVDYLRNAQILSADVNGDGNPDLLTGNTGSVSILLGNGDGTFAAHVDFPASGIGLTVGDVNGDGKPDVVTTESVLLGNGDGTFQTKFDYSPAPTYTPSVVASDLNGDGNADLVTMNTDGNTYFVFLSHGDGTFEPPISHFPGFPAAAFRRSEMASRSAKAPRSTEYYGNEVWLVLRDVNGDGRQDMVFVNGNASQFLSTVAVLLGLGDGTFEPRVDYRIQDYPSYIAIGDLNVDGNPDLVTANDWSGTVSILMGRGDGTFAAHQDYAANGWPCGSVGVGDVNGDGRPDLVSGEGYGTATVYLARADGSFQARRSYECGRMPYHLVIADLDSDGKPDVAAPNWDMPVASILYGNGDGSLTDKTFYEADWNAYNGASGDLDGDGKQDLLITNEYGTTISFLSNGDRTFRRATFHSDWSPAMAVGDLNRDGRADLVHFGSAYLGNGDGTFSPAIPYAVDMDAWPHTLILADLNGDSKLDLVATTYQRAVLWVYLGNGDGSFAPPVDYQLGSVTGSIEVADLNRDGKPDIAAANPGSNAVSVFMNHGDGTLESRVDYPSGGLGTYVVRIGDMDGDGKPDLVAYNYSSGAISIVAGRGDGTFGSSQAYLTPGFRDFVLADLNSDGMPDLVTANTFNFTVSVLLNRGHRAAVLPVRLTLEPGTLNPRSNGPWVAAFIEPVGFSASDIVASSLRLATTLTADPKFAKIVDHDLNGIPELAVRFSRQALSALVGAGENSVEVTGTLVSGETLSGSAQVRIPNPGPHATSVAPNPLNPAGNLYFMVARAGGVRIRVFDQGGRLIKTILDTPAMAAGPHQVALDGRLASGMYFYKIETATDTATGRFTILK